jgi:type IV pilus assembly protein PilA
MKAELKAKFLQYLIARKAGEGFTLIELLVVIIIVGILSAIALPSFLNQANKARQSEAVTYVGSINRGQQAYYLEKDLFAGSIEALGIGVPTRTAYYQYESVSQSMQTDAQAITTATRQTGSVKEYSGVVWLVGSGDSATSLAKVCEGISPTTDCTF